MRGNTESASEEWKWDTTLLDREGWKSDVSRRGDLWKLKDGTIVIRLGCIWEHGYFRDEFCQRVEEVTLCSADHGVSWQEYSGPPLYSAARLSDGTLIAGPPAGIVSPRQDEMKALVGRALGVSEEDLAGCMIGCELWPESKREELEREGYVVGEPKRLPGLICTQPQTSIVIRRSFDGGKTWEERRVEGLPHFAALGLQAPMPLALSDDTLLYVAAGKRKEEDVAGSYVLRSEDKGEAWEVRTVAADASRAHAYNETNILELPDGRLLAMMRHDGPGADGVADHMSTDRYLCRSFSHDKGVTWGAPVKTPIWGFPFHLLPLASGKLLCTYAYRRRPFGIRACLSHDLGETWDIANEIIIRDDARHGGPVGCGHSIQADDGTILTFYGISKVGRIKEKSPYRWYPDEVHPFVGLSRFTENYIRARGQPKPPKDREELAAQSENILDNPLGEPVNLKGGTRSP